VNFSVLDDERKGLFCTPPTEGFTVKGPWKAVSLPFYNDQVNDLASISPIYSADAPLKSTLLSKLPMLFEAELETNDPVDTHILMKGWGKGGKGGKGGRVFQSTDVLHIETR